MATIADLVLNVDYAMEAETGSRAEILVMAPQTWEALSAAFPAAKEQYERDKTLSGRQLILNTEIPLWQIYGFNKIKKLEDYLKLRRLKRVFKDQRRRKRR